MPTAGFDLLFTPHCIISSPLCKVDIAILVSTEYCHCTMSASTNRSARNRVSFSSLGHVAHVPRDGSTWLSMEETRAIQERARDDALRLRTLLANASRGTATLSEEDLVESVGLEEFASRASALRLRARIESHAAVVLAEQESQAQGGGRDAMRLSLVAQSSSQFSRERAHRKALVR